MDEVYFQSLLNKYRNNDITARELSELTAAVNTGAYDESAKASILDALRSEHPQWDADRQRAVFDEILGQITPEAPERKRIPIKRIWWAAAAVLVILATGWLTLNRTRTASTGSEQVAVPDVSPGQQGAVLVLANGQQVVLDSLGNGMVAVQQGAKTMLANGRLVYESENNLGNNLPAQLNSIITPKGRYINIELPDGSNVWLNAASTLRFPLVFQGNERRVELSGEAYFEVAENSTHPFKVVVNQKTEIIVLGTSFNINAYTNEQHIMTTLLTGKVRVNTNKGATAQLSPGQQARIADRITVLDDADTDKAIAWKNGAFDFNNATMEEVMRQLERWYDIEVVYDKHITEVPFSGKISRKTSLKALLKLFEGTSLNFRLEDGNKLVVTSNKQ